MRVILTGSITALAILLLIWTRPETYAELQDLPPATVKVVKVGLMDIQPIHKVTGKLRPSRLVTLQFQVPGQINARFVEAGEYVKEGSILLSIEDDDYIDAVQESRAMLKTEQGAIDRDTSLLDLIERESQLQAREVARLQTLEEDSLSSQSMHDKSAQELYRLQSEAARLRHSLESSRLRLMVEQARLDKAERNLRRTRLKAPFSGVINNINADIGDYILSNEPALEIVQIEMLDLNVEITGAVASRLRLGQKIKIGTTQGERQGKIIALAVDPDPLTNTHTLRIRIPSAGLYAGDLADAFLPGEFYKDAKVVPLSAVLYDDGETYVFTVENGALSRKPVRLIDRYDNLHIVTGIGADMLIVSQDVSSLADGQIVNTH